MRWIAIAPLVTVACASIFACFAGQRVGPSESAAAFTQMAPVFQHPRCMNCHTSDAFPHQGDDQHRHTMMVARGPEDRGAAGLHCGTCHQTENQKASGVPGAPDWHLAPLRMAWQGLSVGALCRSLSDPAHGGMKPDEFASHFNTGLVEWAWAPGVDSKGRARTTPQIGHEKFVELAQKWVAGGAACPN